MAPGGQRVSAGPIFNPLLALQNVKQLTFTSMYVKTKMRPRGRCTLHELVRLVRAANRPCANTFFRWTENVASVALLHGYGTKSTAAPAPAPA
jgi:hypothetical protein